ncbi:hypothetical protein VNO78_04283 [Psophocarpus tetragonolobus]|uniref:Rho GDP-dissociation inhibitor 1 n=1 Tax=Psophocarpus tetragonolobus TaxID=3891 RepID=A0AAN9TFV9_PSOTE
MGFDDNVKDKEGAGDVDASRAHAGKTVTDHEESGDEGGGTLSRYRSESSIAATEDEDDYEERKIELGPQCTLKEQLEKDKDDESLRRWKEQLLGSVDINSVGETLEPNVKIISLAIKSADRPDIVLAIPEDGNPKGLWFSLKEGSRYSLMFTFQVENNIVSGLKYTNTVWKTGIKVDSSKEMIGTFSPQAEPYTHEMPEETTPSGMFARGTYSARSKFVDDDNKCYLEINYTFDIRKEWHFVNKIEFCLLVHNMLLVSSQGSNDYAAKLAEEDARKKVVEASQEVVEANAATKVTDMNNTYKDLAITKESNHQDSIKEREEATPVLQVVEERIQQCITVKLHMIIGASSASQQSFVLVPSALITQPPTQPFVEPVPTS